MPDLVHKISSNSDTTDSNSTDDEGMPVPARASKKEEGAKRSSREDAYANAAPEVGSSSAKDQNAQRRAQTWIVKIAQALAGGAAEMKAATEVRRIVYGTNMDDPHTHIHTKGAWVPTTVSQLEVFRPPPQRALLTLPTLTPLLCSSLFTLLCTRITRRYSKRSLA